MTAKGYGVSFWRGENVLKLITVVELREYTIDH